MDKTGTLTTGQMHVTSCHILDPQLHDKEELFMLVCCVEEAHALMHPTARAIFRWMLPQIRIRWQNLKTNMKIRNTLSALGKGVKGEVQVNNGDWREVCVGNLEMLVDNSIDVSGWNSPGDNPGMVIHLAVEHRYVGHLTLNVSFLKHLDLLWYISNNI